MTEEEKNALLIKKAGEEAGKQVRLMLDAELGKAVDTNESIKACLAFQAKFEAAKTTEQIETLMKKGGEFDQLKETVAAFKAQLEGKNKPAKKGIYSLESIVRKGLKEQFTKGNFAKLKNDSGMSLKITPALFDGAGKKVDNPMSDTTSIIPIGSGAPAFSITQFEPGLTRVTRRKPYIIQLVDFARTMDRYIAWVEQTNIDTGIAFSILEGGSATSDYGSFRWTENSIRCEEIVALSKATRVILDDLQETQAQIQKEIIELLQLKLDHQIVFGNNTAPQLDGIINHAQAFVNAGGLSVPNPNNFDALIAAQLQIKINGQKSGVSAGGELIYLFEPSEIVVNPADATQMQLTKDSLGRYVIDQMTYPDEVFKGGKMIGDCRITENVDMPVGSFLVMDAKKSHVRMREDAEITLGYVGSDFQDGLVTFRGALRAAHFIKTIENRAFVYDTFANAKTAITPAP